MDEKEAFAGWCRSFYLHIISTVQSTANFGGAWKFKVRQKKKKELSVMTQTWSTASEVCWFRMDSCQKRASF